MVARLRLTQAAPRSHHARRAPGGPSLGGSILSLAGLLVAEWMLGLPVLTLAPLILLLGTATTFWMAAILSGTHDLHTAAHLAGVGLMLLFPNASMIIIGLVGGAVFIVLGIAILRRARRGKPGSQRRPTAST